MAKDKPEWQIRSETLDGEQNALVFDNEREARTRYAELLSKASHDTHNMITEWELVEVHELHGLGLGAQVGEDDIGEGDL